MSDWTPTDAIAPAEDRSSMPHDMNAEQSVVGSMLLSKTAIDDVLDEMTAADFYQPKHQLIAESILRLTGHGAPTDVITVSDELDARGEITKAGGADYLHHLTSLVVTTSNAGYHAQIVHEHAVRRRVIETCTRAIQSAHNRDRAVGDVVESARADMDAVETGRRKQVRMVWETLDKLAEKLQEKPTYSPTPWKSIDRIIGGWSPGSFYVVAARPGSGKTMAVLQAAMRLAKVGSVAFMSMEMGEEELQQRLLADYGDLHQTVIRDHALSSSDWEKVARARERIMGAPLAIDPSGNVTIADIRSHARAVSRTGKLSAIIIDYLQLVEGEGQDRRVVVDNVSRGLKQLARDFQVPVIAAAQLKRPAPQKGKQRVLPTLADLREAGGIEANADVVLLLDRGIEAEARDLTVVVAKNRHGDQKQVTLRWEGEYARVVDRRWTPTALIDEDEMRRTQ
jgi:replicative DNA helicase